MLCLNTVGGTDLYWEDVVFCQAIIDNGSIQINYDAPFYIWIEKLTKYKLWSSNYISIYQVNVVPSSPVLGENVQQGEGDGEVAHEEPRDGQVSDEDVLSGQSHL